MQKQFSTLLYWFIVVSAVGVGVWRIASLDDDESMLSKQAKAMSASPAGSEILLANAAVLRPEAPPVEDDLPVVDAEVTAHPPPPRNALAPQLDARSLHLRSIHTGEEIKITFWQDGAYVESALEKLDYFLRDHRDGEVVRMDPELFMLLYRLYDDMDAKGPIEVISGHRSAGTNAMLRAKGRKVARKSQHILGKAIDVRMRGVSLKKMRDTALGYGIGGVGYYPGDGFIHVDTGPPRFW